MIRKHLLYLTFITLIASTNLLAQSVVISGWVRDGATSEPLVGVTIRTPDSRYGTVSRADGSYRLKLPNITEVTLEASCIGYLPVRERISITTHTLRHDFRLESKSTQLGNVVVETRSEARLLRESSLPVSVITARQLEGTASSINDVLARTVGVTIRNTGGMGSASRISVRGLEGKRMGLYIDEVPLNALDNFVSLNDIPTNMIERIEVYKGIVPHKLGGSALGGAVNVVMKEYPPVYFDGSYEISSFNTHQASSVFKRTFSSGLQIGAGGVYSHSDNNYSMRLRHLDDRIVTRDHDHFTKWMGGMSLKQTQWWADEIKWELLFTKTLQELQGIDMNVREAFNRSQMLGTSLSIKKQNAWWDGFDFNLDAAYMYGAFGQVDKALKRYDWDGNELPPMSPYGGEQSAIPSDSHNRSHTFNAKLNLGYTLSERHAFNLNLLQTFVYQDPRNELMDKALGHKANFPSTMHNVTLGLSYDLTLLDGKLLNSTTLKEYGYFSKAKALQNFIIDHVEDVNTSKFSTGISNATRYWLTPLWMIKLGLSSEVRVPTAEELIGNGYSIIPSTMLNPERVHGLNLGTLYRKEIANGIIEGELNLYYNRLKEMIRYTPETIPTLASYRNFGDVRTMGIELEVKGDLTKQLFLYGNATYQDLRDVRRYTPNTEVENPSYMHRMPNVPYFMANAGVEYHQANLFGGKGQYTRILSDFSYIHDYFYDFEMSEYQERKIPKTYQLDAAVEHSFQEGRWTLTAKCKNVLDREHYSELNNPLPGRSFWLKVRFLLH